MNSFLAVQNDEIESVLIVKCFTVVEGDVTIAGYIVSGSGNVVVHRAARHELAVSPNGQGRKVRIVEEHHLPVTVSEKVRQLQGQDPFLGLMALPVILRINCGRRCSLLDAKR